MSGPVGGSGGVGAKGVVVMSDKTLCADGQESLVEPQAAAGTNESHSTEERRLLIQPLPWSPHRNGGYSVVRDANGFVVFSHVTHDEAQFIVRAVNHHHELVAALKWFLCAGTEREMDRARDKAEAALAKVNR